MFGSMGRQADDDEPGPVMENFECAGSLVVSWCTSAQPEHQASRFADECIVQPLIPHERSL